jgi:methionine-rich copper-binding protein CopC
VRIPALFAAVALGLAAPGAVSAHISVTGATPAEGSTVKSTKTITITFDKPVDQATAAASIVMTAMPGMPNHGEMLIRNFTTAWSQDRKTLTLKLANHLPKGTYEVRWQARGADGHAITGVVNFKVA